MSRDRSDWKQELKRIKVIVNFIISAALGVPNLIDVLFTVGEYLNKKKQERGTLTRVHGSITHSWSIFQTQMKDIKSIYYSKLDNEFCGLAFDRADELRYETIQTGFRDIQRVVPRDIDGKLLSPIVGYAYSLSVLTKDFIYSESDCISIDIEMFEPKESMKQLAELMKGISNITRALDSLRNLNRRDLKRTRPEDIFRNYVFIGDIARRFIPAIGWHISREEIPHSDYLEQPEILHLVFDSMTKQVLSSSRVNMRIDQFANHLNIPNSFAQRIVSDLINEGELKLFLTNDGLLIDWTTGMDHFTDLISSNPDNINKILMKFGINENQAIVFILDSIKRKMQTVSM